MCDGLRGNLSLYSPDDTNDYDFDEAKLFDHYGESIDSTYMYTSQVEQ